MKNNYDIQDPHCSECGKPCAYHEAEVGIGGYEYAGFSGTDIRYNIFSDCCDAEVVEGTNSELLCKQIAGLCDSLIHNMDIIAKSLKESISTIQDDMGEL